MTVKVRFKDPNPPVSIEAWRTLARRRLPKLAWNYVDGGADDLITVTSNIKSFQRWTLRQRCLTGIKDPQLGVTVAGDRLALPVALAPTGAAGLSHWTADIAATRAAEQAGTRAVLSTAASYSLEEVAEATEHKHWFQLYPFSNREKVAALMDRARAAGYTALFVTVDVPVIGNREGERTSGMTRPWSLTPLRLLDMALHPRWVYGALRHRRLAAIHYVEREQAGAAGAAFGAANTAIASAENQERHMQGDLHWADLAWMRDRWPGPLYVKGVLDADDAQYAVDAIGVQGIVVSNHGGRQLDRSVAAIDALPAIVARVGDRAEVLLDGGVRRGTDVITALCLGAKAVLIGRPYLYGLAVAGQAGVAGVLEILRSEIHRAMVLMGCASVEDLDHAQLAGQQGGVGQQRLMNRQGGLLEGASHGTLVKTT